VKTSRGRAISRKDRTRSGILRDCTPDRVLPGADDTVRTAWQHAERGRNDRASPTQLVSNKIERS
jgi:hypothetical protein